MEVAGWLMIRHTDKHGSTVRVSKPLVCNNTDASLAITGVPRGNCKQPEICFYLLSTLQQVHSVSDADNYQLTVPDTMSSGQSLLHSGLS